MPEHSISGHCAVITGAGSGIGRAMAERFAAAGARVVVADRDLEAATTTVENIIAAGGHARAEHCDVTQPGAVEALLDSARTTYGALQVMINNVGLSIDGRLEDFSDRDWDRIVAINLSATFYGTRAALRRMAPADRGSIINISSGAGLFGAPGMGPYGACKAGVINLTQTAAVEHAGTGVRINCIVPGAIATPALLTWADRQPGGREAYEQRLIPKRLGLPAEIAAAALFLASDEASFITGVALPVDGGASVRMPASIQ